VSQRLFVTKITSVGAVESPDNDEARIMLFKEKNTDSVSTGEPVMDNEEREAFVKTITELEAKVAELTVEPEDVMKDATDDVKEQFAKQAAEIEKQATELAKERDARLTAEYAKTAEKYTRILGDDGGQMLKAFSQHDEYTQLIEKLDAMSVLVETSDVFKEFGTQDSGDPVTQIETLAVEKRKTNPDLTDAQARILVRAERPDLKDAEREMV